MTFTSKAAGTQAGRGGVGRRGRTEIRIPALPLLADLLFGQINFSELSSLHRVVCEKCLTILIASCHLFWWVYYKLGLALSFSTSLQGVGPSTIWDLMQMLEATHTLPGDIVALESDPILLKVSF